MINIAKILLPYQRRWVGDTSRVRVWEKSRRIGASYCEALQSVMEAAKNRPVFSFAWNAPFPGAFCLPALRFPHRAIPPGAYQRSEPCPTPNNPLN